MSTEKAPGRIWAVMREETLRQNLCSQGHAIPSDLSKTTVLPTSFQKIYFLIFTESQWDSLAIFLVKAKWNWCNTNIGYVRKAEPRFDIQQRTHRKENLREQAYAVSRYLSSPEDPHRRETMFVCCLSQNIHECTLHGHKRSHVEKKTYCCVDCGKSFNCKKSLTAH